MAELPLEDVMKTTFKTFKERELLFRDLEEMGREKAFKSDELPESDKVFFEKIMASSRIMRDELRELNMKKEARLPLYVSLVAEYSAPIADHCEGAKIPRKDCVITPQNQGVLWSLIEDVNTLSLELIKRKCTFLWGEREPYNLPSLLNDVTACYHRGLEFYVDNVGKWQKEGKCSWRIK